MVYPSDIHGISQPSWKTRTMKRVLANTFEKTSRQVSSVSKEQLQNWSFSAAKLFGLSPPKITRTTRLESPNLPALKQIFIVEQWTPKRKMALVRKIPANQSRVVAISSLSKCCPIVCWILYIPCGGNLCPQHS